MAQTTQPTAGARPLGGAFDQATYGLLVIVGLGVGPLSVDHHRRAGAGR